MKTIFFCRHRGHASLLHAISIVYYALLSHQILGLFSGQHISEIFRVRVLENRFRELVKFPLGSNEA